MEKTMTKAQIREQAIKQGQDLNRMGMIIKLVCLTVFIVAAWGIYSLCSLVMDDSHRLNKVTAPAAE